MLQGAEITVAVFTLEPLHGPSQQITHRITLSGGDQPGMIACLSELFIEFKANIVRLVSETGGDGAKYRRGVAAVLSLGCGLNGFDPTPDYGKFKSGVKPNNRQTPWLAQKTPSII